jgi:hypothetical protein
MRPNQIYTNGIITNHKPFKEPIEEHPLAWLTLVVGLVELAAAIYLIFIR